jgi:hypothetical protein
VAEGSLVGEAEVSAAVGEGEPGPHVRRKRPVRVADQKLAAHPQVGEERLIVVDNEPEVFPASFRALERTAGQGRGKAIGASEMAAHRPRVQHLDTGDRTAHDVAVKTRTDGLDLG